MAGNGIENDPSTCDPTIGVEYTQIPEVVQQLLASGKMRICMICAGLGVHLHAKFECINQRIETKEKKLETLCAVMRELLTTRDQSTLLDTRTHGRFHAGRPYTARYAKIPAIKTRT